MTAPARNDGRGGDGRAPERLVRPTVYSREHRFNADLSKRPRGYVYEWKMCRCMGKDERGNIAVSEAYHWKPVPLGRHPELDPWRNLTNTSGYEIDGQILMERPEYLSDEARREHLGKTKYETHQFLASIKNKSAEEIGIGQGRTQLKLEQVRTGNGESQGAPIV